jgi:hypothetical protein
MVIAFNAAAKNNHWLYLNQAGPALAKRPGKKGRNNDAGRRFESVKASRGRFSK